MRRFLPVIICVIVLIAAIALPAVYVVNKQNSLPEVDNTKPAIEVSDNSTDEGQTETDGNIKNEDDKNSSKDKKKKGKKTSKKSNKKSNDSDDESEEYQDVAVKYLNYLCNFEFERMISLVPDGIAAIDNMEDDLNYVNQMEKTLKSYEGVDISYSGNMEDFEKVNNETTELWGKLIDIGAGAGKYEYSEIYQAKVNLVMTVSYKGNSQSESTVLYIVVFNENGKWKALSMDKSFEDYMSGTSGLTQ